MVEVEGKIFDQSISILFDLGYSHNNVTRKIIETCAIKKCKHGKSWLVYLATRTKRKVSEMVENCPLKVNRLFRCVNVNIFPLGSYDVLVGSTSN